MDSILDIIHENVDIFYQNMLVITIVSHELDQEYIALLENSEIRVWIFCAIKALLLDNDERDFIRSKVL